MTIAGDQFQLGRRAAVAGLACALLAVAVVPAAAEAAAALSIDPRGTLRLDAAGGETDNVVAREDASGIIVTDSAGVVTQFIEPGRPRCLRLDSRTARCPVPRRFELRLGRGDDSAKVHVVRAPVAIDGQDGNDRYFGGESSAVSHVQFRGGDGVDTALYGASGVGVRVSNDGRFDDGRIGIDAENIDRNVEEIVGSNVADELISASDTFLQGVPLLNGLRGDDVLRDQTAAFTIFSLGSSPDGADRIFGDHSSQVDHEGRTRPVNVTPNAGGADDGEPGERDEIIGDVRNLLGGEGGDTIAVPAGSRADHFLGGRGGGDTLRGGEGSDKLFGGPGVDDYVAGGGDDEVVADDGVGEFLFCGEGFDLFAIDGFDRTSGCEQARVGVLRLVPAALRAAAGEPVRLALSWRHPRDWRELRRIELRVFDGEVPVGAVTMRPGARRLSAEGAVRLSRHAGRITREGRAVRARLALRLDGVPGGRRLRLEVEAVDAGGARQVESRAGSIRIAD